MHRSNSTSLDDLVGAKQERLRNLEAERLGGGEVDDEIELDRLRDWKVGGLGAAQNFVHVLGGAPEQVRKVCSIGHEPCHFDVLPSREHCRQPQSQRQGVDTNPVRELEWVAADLECVSPA